MIFAESKDWYGTLFAMNNQLLHLPKLRNSDLQAAPCHYLMLEDFEPEGVRGD
jgi:hypothetical protein